MAKSKNHTNHNQGESLSLIEEGDSLLLYYISSKLAFIIVSIFRICVTGHKNHRNGIKRPKMHRYPSLKGVDPKFLRNMRFAKKHNKRNRKSQEMDTA